jgi:hypothetical protein
MYFNPNSTILAGVSQATLQQWLTDAQTAYSQLVTGGRPVTVSYDGKSVSYTAADVTKLESWIVSLQKQLGVNIGRRALRPYFR